ncbi:hypothetical protein BGZ83_010375 [Gryganskiella cystojenkinii]|nr:hypothetical protein BGZ83_010375 [Gryganskiella cystojenkinii]
MSTPSPDPESEEDDAHSPQYTYSHSLPPTTQASGSSNNNDYSNSQQAAAPVPEKASILTIQPQSELISIKDFSRQAHNLVLQEQGIQHEVYLAYFQERARIQQERSNNAQQLQQQLQQEQGYSDEEAKTAARCDVSEHLAVANELFDDPTLAGLLEEWYYEKLEDNQEQVTKNSDRSLRPTWTSVYGQIDEVNEVGDPAQVRLNIARPATQQYAGGHTDNKLRRLLSAPARGRRRVPYDSNRSAQRILEEKQRDHTLKNLQKHPTREGLIRLSKERLKLKDGIHDEEREEDIDDGGDGKEPDRPLGRRKYAWKSNPKPLAGPSTTLDPNTTPDAMELDEDEEEGVLSDPEAEALARQLRNQHEQNMAVRITELETVRIEKEYNTLRPTSVENRFQEYSLKLEDSTLRSLNEHSHFVLPPHQREPLNYLKPRPDLDAGASIPVTDPEETIISVEFYSALKPTRKLQETLFLGSQHLTALRDTFHCLSDFTSKSEYDERISEIHQIKNTETRKASNSFFFIERVFYIDSPLIRARSDVKNRLLEEGRRKRKEIQDEIDKLHAEAVVVRDRWLASLAKEGQASIPQDHVLIYDDADLRAKLNEPSIEHTPLEEIEIEDEAIYAEASNDYSQAILDWVNQDPNRRQSPEFKNLSKQVMDETLIKDLSIRLDHPYLMVHQGHCQHIIKFKDLRLFSQQHDEIDRRAYPKPVFQRKTFTHKCKMCQFNKAFFITVDDRLAGETPCYFCEQCYYDFHYDEDGNLLYDDFRVFLYSSVTDQKE